MKKPVPSAAQPRRESAPEVGRGGACEQALRHSRREASNGTERQATPSPGPTRSSKSATSSWISGATSASSAARRSSFPLKEFELLEMLLSNPGRVVTRDTLIDRVWGMDYVGDTKTLDVHIKRLRSRIEQDPSKPVLITTIRGLGYRFESPRR